MKIFKGSIILNFFLDSVKVDESLFQNLDDLELEDDDDDEDPNFEPNVSEDSA